MQLKILSSTRNTQHQNTVKWIWSLIGVASIFTNGKRTVKRTVNRDISSLQVTIQAWQQGDAEIFRAIDGQEEYVLAPKSAKSWRNIVFLPFVYEVSNSGS